MIIKKTKKYFSQKVTKRNQRGGSKPPGSEPPKTKNKYQTMNNYDLHKKLETRGLRSLFGRMKARKELTRRRKELNNSQPVDLSTFLQKPSTPSTPSTPSPPKRPYEQFKVMGTESVLKEFLVNKPNDLSKANIENAFAKASSQDFINSTLTQIRANYGNEVANSTNKTGITSTALLGHNNSRIGTALVEFLQKKAQTNARKLNTQANQFNTNARRYAREQGIQSSNYRNIYAQHLNSRSLNIKKLMNKATESINKQRAKEKRLKLMSHASPGEMD